MAIGATRTYNLAQCLITINGVPIEGFGETDAISFAPNSNVFENTVGADGENTRSATNDRSQEATLTLMQTSPSLGLLYDLLNLAQNGLPGDIFALYINDLNNREEVVVEQAWIEREADQAFGKAAGERAWTIRCAKKTTRKY